MLRKSVYESGLSDHRYGIWALPFLLTIPPPPPPPLCGQIMSSIPLIKDRSANPFPFYEKEKETKFHQKIVGTDVATPPEMTFEEPLSPGFHCPSVWLQLGEGGSTVQ